MRGPALAALGLALLLAPPARAGDEVPVVTPVALERAIARAVEEGDHERAARLIEGWLEDHPDDPTLLYNLACAWSRAGHLETAGSALFRAVRAGFRDFAHMQQDADLEPIRDLEIYKAILEAARRVEGEHAEDTLERWRKTFGADRYRYEIDRDRKLAFATALDEVSHGEMRAMLQREADHLVKAFFGAPPDYFVLIAVPAPDDARHLFGDDPATRGRYDHARHTLISRDTGGSLRHELVHALHYGHMERLGLRTPHALWIQEGLAALYEDCEIAPDGSVTYLPNERTNVIKRLARVGRTRPWRDFLAMTPERFMARPGQNYPQARSMLAYLAERGKLEAWYRAYVDGFAGDPTGAAAFETVLGAPIEDIERAWIEWARRRPTVDTTIAPGDAALGVESDPDASNDGVLVAQVRPGSSAARAGIRSGDVIVAVDGRTTRSLPELQTIIGAHRVGDRILVRVRRRGRYFALDVLLRPLRPLPR